MMFEVQNGTVQTRKRNIFHSRDWTWNTRKYATLNPMNNGKIEGDRQAGRKHLLVIVEHKGRDGLKIDVVEEADDHDGDQRYAEKHQKD
jgi:hypothetical protein